MSPMTSATGPPRIVRYVTPEVMPNNQTVSMLDKHQNLLFVVKELLIQLTPSEQKQVLSTDSKYLEIKST